MLEELKNKVCEYNKKLAEEKLVVMTSGNVSGRDIESGLIVIKPSGVAFGELTPDEMVVVDAAGKIVEGRRRPSVDLETHLYIYRERDDVMGIVHTHSNYATSFAALGQPIPCVLTEMADEFGGPVPIGPYASVGGEQIGRNVVRHIGSSSAIIMQNHGVFAIGPSVEKAFKSALLCEDAAKSVHLAFLRGTPISIPEQEVRRAHQAYQSNYGQRQ